MTYFIEASVGLTTEYFTMAGKGDTPRPVDKEKYERNFERIFGRKHVFHECGPECDNEFCPYCRGGLAHCKVCGQAEADLEDVCPGPQDDS